MLKQFSWLLILLVIILITGCIRSRLVVDSQPPEAKVTVNNEYRGRTPIEIPFIWYWYYDIELEKEGYENLSSRERLYAPPWFWMPFDLIMEALPFPIYDTKYRLYTLNPTEKQEL